MESPKKRDKQMQLFRSVTQFFRSKRVSELKNKREDKKDRQRRFQLIKKSYENNFLSNVLKNVDENFFKTTAQSSLPLLSKLDSKISEESSYDY